MDRERERDRGRDTRGLQLLIGAGPVGLATAKALGEAGVAYDHVEATDHVGGNWAHGVYETAHIISSRRTTEYTDYPMPAHYPDFPSKQQMWDYFESYADAFDLRRHIRFETRVTEVRPRPDELWDVAFADGRRAVYKGVIVCNGHHWKKSFPKWVDDYEGKVIHSKDYKKPDQLRGKRILVLGGGNSGSDLVSEAARVGASADWSLRRGYWFMPKTVFGRPSVELINPWVPVFVQRLFIRAMLRFVVGRYENYGLPHPDHRIFDAHPTIATEALHYLKHGRITVRPDVTRAEGDEVVFADGARARYDLVVCATGYDVAWPFVQGIEIPYNDAKTPALYGGLMLPAHRHLYLVGAYQVRYGLGPLVRPASQLLADWVKLQDELPVPLGRVLQRMRVKPPRRHVMDPHRVRRAIELGRRLVPLVRSIGKRMEPEQNRATPAPAPAAPAPAREEVAV